MRVLFLVNDYPSETDPAKCIFHKTQVEALSRLGVSVDVVAPVPAVPLGLHLVRKRWRKYRGVPRMYAWGAAQIYRPRYLHWPLRMHLGPGAEMAFGRAAMRVLSSKPDLVHAHFAYAPGLAGAWLARRLRVPSVLTLHGSDVNVFPGVNNRMRARVVGAVVSADAVTAVSRALAQRADELTGRLPKVMPIGIQLARFRGVPSRETARRSLGLPEEPPIVGYVGNLAPKKGVGEFLNALRCLAGDGIRGLVVGDGPLRSAVGAAEQVRYFGSQPNERIPVFMAALDVLVLPSYSEGLPTVLVEAGAVGVPVVAAAVGGVPELLADGRGMLIPPGSVDALVDAIRKVLRDPRAADERAMDFRQHVTEHYDADLNAARLLEMYRSLC